MFKYLQYGAFIKRVQVFIQLRDYVKGLCISKFTRISLIRTFFGYRPYIINLREKFFCFC